jgi:hypothetical protein
MELARLLKRSCFDLPLLGHLLGMGGCPMEGLCIRLTVLYVLYTIGKWLELGCVI